MSELKVYHHELRHNEYEEFYLKSEADKVIADLKEQIEVLKNQSCKMNCMTVKLYNEVCDDNIHQKYKRCLAMARWCESEAYIHEHGSEYDEDLVAWFGKWYKRWLELAEKFKEAK